MNTTALDLSDWAWLAGFALMVIGVTIGIVAFWAMKAVVRRLGISDWEWLGALALCAIASIAAIALQSWLVKSGRQWVTQ